MGKVLENNKNENVENNKEIDNKELDNKELDNKELDNKELGNNNDTDFKKKSAESKNILERYPDRIPVIVNKHDNAQLPDIDKTKYLVPIDLTIGQFMYVIRKRISLEPEQAMFLFVGGVLPTTSDLMSKIYKEFKNDDGFLYITYSGENTFGK